jgi:hypothetical protein
MCARWIKHKHRVYLLRTMKCLRRQQKVSNFIDSMDMCIYVHGGDDDAAGLLLVIGLEKKE